MYYSYWKEHHHDDIRTVSNHLVSNVVSVIGI